MSARQVYVFLGLAILLTIIATVQSAPASATKQAAIYLSQFGFLTVPARNTDNGVLSEMVSLDADVLLNAIQDFQSFVGLNVTGELDDDTIQMMSRPRCGVRDKMDTDDRMSDYVVGRNKWDETDLTYKISEYSQRINRADVDAAVAKAFSFWSGVTDLTFTRKYSGSVNIEIRFVQRQHGDADFDGPLGTLAHAFFPDNGDTHFDDAEQWTVNTHRGTNLVQVAAHEFGHALGISHSRVPAALMAPSYSGYEPDFELHNDDILAIQALYGKKSTRHTTQRPTTRAATRAPQRSPQDDDDLICEDTTIDAIVNSDDGQTYALKGNKYYLLTRHNAVPEGYPKLISEGWPGLPSDIDAAFNDCKTFFFKGTKYWCYDGSEMDGDYPRRISDDFPGIPDHLDAAMVGADHKFYFFKGSKYWVYDPSAEPPVDYYLYPQPISNWRRMPNNIDAALQHNGVTYFFKGTKFYEFNNGELGFQARHSPKAISSGGRWFGCHKPSTGRSYYQFPITYYYH